MYCRKRNNAFARCVAERYQDYEEEPMEMQKLTPEELQAFKRTKARCKELMEQHDGVCDGDMSGVCPFYDNCQNPPDDWYLDESPQLTDREEHLLSILGAAGADVVGKTAYGTPYWRYEDDDLFFGKTLPLHVLPSVKPGQEIQIDHASCVEKEEP